MKLNYYPETDSLYIDLSSEESTSTIEISEGVVADYGASGGLVGIDIDNASRKLDIKELAFNHLPFLTQKIAAQDIISIAPVCGSHVLV